MKNNGNMWKIVGILIALGLAIAGWIWNAAIVFGEVNHNKIAINELKAVDVSMNNEFRQKDKELKDTDKNMQDEIQMTQQSIIKLQSDVSYIKEGIDEIKIEIRNQ